VYICICVSTDVEEVFHCIYVSSFILKKLLEYYLNVSA